MIIALVLWKFSSFKTTDDNYNAYAVAINILSATQQKSILHAGRLCGGSPRGTDCKKYKSIELSMGGLFHVFCLFVCFSFSSSRLSMVSKYEQYTRLELQIKAIWYIRGEYHMKIVFSWEKSVAVIYIFTYKNRTIWRSKVNIYFF